jgi:hypothetical protein
MYHSLYTVHCSPCTWLLTYFPIILIECACSVCAHLYDFFVLMYFIVNTSIEIGFVARLNIVYIWLVSAKHTPGTFYVLGPLMAEKPGSEFCSWLTCILSQ